MTRAARLLPSLAIVVAAAVASPAARAQSAEDVATAKAAVVQARELRARGDLKGALPKFQAAYALVPTPLTALDYGTTLASVGHLVEAREVLSAVAKMPGEGKEDEVHRKARVQAAELAEQLQARIPSLTISVLSTAPARVAVDGREVPAAALSVARRLNPGHHTVTASVEGGPSRSAEVDLKESESKQVSLDLTAPPAPAAQATAPATGSPPPLSAPPPASREEGGGLGGARTLALILGGGGIVVTGVGLALNLTGKSSYTSAVSHCANNLCTPGDANNASSAATQGTIGAVVLGVGVLTIAGAAVIWFTAPHNSARATGAGVSAGVALAPNGVLLHGAF